MPGPRVSSRSQTNAGNSDSNITSADGARSTPTPSSQNGSWSGPRAQPSPGSIGAFQAASNQRSGRTGDLWDVLDNDVPDAPVAKPRHSHSAKHHKQNGAQHNKPATPPAKTRGSHSPAAKPVATPAPHSDAPKLSQPIVEARKPPAVRDVGTPAQRDSISALVPTAPQHGGPSTHADTMKALRALKPTDLDNDDNDAAWRAIKECVAWANVPLKEKEEHRWTKDAPQARFNEAMLRLEQATKNLPQWLAVAVVKEALPDYEAFRRNNHASLDNDQFYSSGGDGPGGNPAINIALFATVADRVAGNPEGDDAVSRLVAVGGWPKGPGSRSVSLAIGNGGSLVYALEAARQLKAGGDDPSPIYKVINTGIDRFNENTRRDYDALLNHRARLASVVRDLAPIATPDELNAVTADFLKNHPEWEKKDRDLQRRVAENGINHLHHLKQLRPERRNNAVDAKVLQRLQEGITNNEAARIAISMAIHHDPRLANVDSELYREAATAIVGLTNSTARSLVELGRKLTGELAAQALHGRLISIMRNRRLDAAGLEALRRDIRALLKGRFSAIWGVSPSALKAISTDVDELIGEMLAVEGLNSSLAAQTIGLGKFHKNLDKTKVFSADTVAGQAMRGFASALAIAGMALSLQKATDEPTALNAAKAGVDTLSALQKTSDLLRSLGLRNSVVQGLGGGWKIALQNGARLGASEIFTLATALVEGAQAASSFYDGRIAEGAFSAGIAAGGIISMLPAILETGSWGGPVGVGIMTTLFVGRMVWQNAKHVHDGEDDVRQGLIALGYRASHAAILCKRGDYSTGDTAGVGQMQALMHYAKWKGWTTAQLRDWINSLTPEQVSNLSDITLREMGGNANLRFDPEEAKKQSAYIIPKDAGAARDGFSAASFIGKNGVRRHTAIDFEAMLRSRGVFVPFVRGALT